MFAGLFKTLLDDFFYTHERADVQLYAAICLADIIRIWAPNLPDASPEKKLVRSVAFPSTPIDFDHLFPLEYVSVPCASIERLEEDR